MSERPAAQAAVDPAASPGPRPLLPADHPMGTQVLVLGLVGLLVPICAPVAWYLGTRALGEIRTSGSRWANEQHIVVGRLLGFAVTLLLVVAATFVIVFAAIVLISTAVGRG